MSSDRESRALGAGESVEVNGKIYKLRPVAAQHLADLEREALRDYRKQYLSTYADSLDLLPEDQRMKIMEKKLDEVARWDLSDLPQKDAYDVSRVPLTEPLRKWLGDNYGELPGDSEARDDNAAAGEDKGSDVAGTESRVRALLVMALDSGKITPAQVREMTGKGPIHGRVRYDQWWITATVNGMLAFITVSIRYDHPEVKREEIGNWPIPKIIETARIVEALSAASLGNS